MSTEWLDPWYPVTDATICDALERQLRAEISSRHVLFRERVRLVARRSDTDDALFALSGSRVAEVHLTWSRQVEADPRWPMTVLFGSMEEWRRASMMPLHDELSAICNRRGDN